MDEQVDESYAVAFGKLPEEVRAIAEQFATDTYNRGYAAGWSDAEGDIEMFRQKAIALIMRK